MNQQPKLFLALWPGDAVRDSLVKWRDGWEWPSGATPVRSDLLHMTLHFIGPVDAGRVDELASALAMPLSPFEMFFGRSSVWQNGVAVLEPDEIPMGLARLHAGLGDALAACGVLPEQRDYRPHVTLARRAANATHGQDGPRICWRAGGYALMSSTPGPDGGYTVVRRYG